MCADVAARAVVGSPLVQGRGLKHQRRVKAGSGALSPLVQGRGLKPDDAL